MSWRWRALIGILTISIIGPISIGAISGALLQDNSEYYPTRELAYEYFNAILDNSPSLVRKRNEYRRIGKDQFGQDRLSFASCSLHYDLHMTAHEAYTENFQSDFFDLVRKANLADLSVRIQRRLKLENTFDSAAVEGLARSGTLTGALGGCRYSPIFLVCDAIGHETIRNSLEANEEGLLRARSEIDDRFESVACSIIEDYNEQYETMRNEVE